MTCPHYRRKCQFLSPCCDKIYDCRICHDNSEDHDLDRKSVKVLICIQCDGEQGVSRNCIFCGILFGTYSCLDCRLFDDTDRAQFHCAGCGVCRVGGAHNYYHCPKCNMCIANAIKHTHKCVENMSRSMCPVCLDDLHASRKKVRIPECSHMIHEQCFKILLKHGKKCCPTCRAPLK